jgi:hypothetical protein
VIAPFEQSRSLASRDPIREYHAVRGRVLPVLGNRLPPARLQLMYACAVGGIMMVLTGDRLSLGFGSDVAVWLTAGALSFLALCGWRLSRAEGENPWIAPSYLLMALYFFRYGWGALVAYYWHLLPWEAHPEMKNYFFNGGVWFNLSPACRLAFLGGLGLFIGLNLRGNMLSAFLPKFSWPVSYPKLKVSLFIWTPTILLTYWLVHAHLSKGITFMVVAVASITDGMMILGSYFLFCKPGKQRIRWAIFVVIGYLFALPTAASSGQMEPLLMPAVMILCGYVLARRSVPWIWIVVAAPLALFCVLPFTAFYKYSGAPKPSDRVWYAVEAYSKATSESKFELSLSRTVARFSGPSFPATFLQYYPSVYPFEFGRTFLLESSGLIPRIIWPEKPEVSPELNRYSEQVGLVARDSGTSMVFDGVSEYYVNFGEAGVFFLSIINGWYLSALYKWLVRDGQYLIGSAIFLPLILNNWDSFGVVAIVMTHLRVLPVWALAYYLMSRRTYAQNYAF